MLARWMHQPAAVFLFALAILLPVNVISVVSSEWFTEPPKPTGDGLDYENLAYHVSTGQGFVIDTQDENWLRPYQQSATTYQALLDAEPRNLIVTGRPPLYPTCLALIYSIFGRQAVGFAAVRLFSAICLAVAEALAVSLTARILPAPETSSPKGRKHDIALVSALISVVGLAASHRTLRDYATDFLTEPMALLATQLFVLMVFRYFVSHPADATNRNLRGATVCGVLLGAMILTRSVFVLWLPGIWLLIYLSPTYEPAESSMIRLRQASWVILVAMLCCAPWWLRNIIVLERWMPLGTQGPITLLGGYCDEAMQNRGDWSFTPEQELRRQMRLETKFRLASSDSIREALLAEEASRRVRKWVGNHWSSLPKLVSQRVATHWNPYTGRSLVWKLLIVIGIIGLIRSNRRSLLWLLGMPLLSTLVAAGLYTTGGRFLIPMYGHLFCLSGAGVYFVTYRTLLGIVPKPEKSTHHEPAA